MRRSLVAVLGAAVVVTLSAQVAVAAPGGSDRLDVYTAKVKANELSTLVSQGFDVSDQQRVGDRIEVDFVATRSQQESLAQEGIDAGLKLIRGGQTVRQFAAAQSENGFEVWRSWDEPGGHEDQMHQIARRNPQITKLVDIGDTVQGRDILALKLTQNAREEADGSRPAVLYMGAQHAREWISPEVTRRLLLSYINAWRANNKGVKRLLKTSELWFMPVVNPDGYEYTFDAERLWRKNLRDNNGDGEITIGDGVDLNRNFPNHFNYDEEGSSSVTSSDTYRGPSAVSEPETAALKGLLDRIGFEFIVNNHSVGEWLLYAEGWQIAAPTADDPIYFALSGNLDEPAVPGFHPGVSSDVLYVTNGETTDYGHAGTGALGWTPELGDGCPDEDCGFVFPDNEQRVQEEFERIRPFLNSVARSADDPDDPESVLGIETKPFYVKSDDPYKEGIPAANFTFDYSYGDPQPVAVLAKRSLGDVTVHYRINGGEEQTASTSEWEGGERFNPADVYYHQVRGTVTGTDPGDEVEVWFEGGGERSESFTYEAVSETGNRVLVVAAEDYTGASPAQAPGPHYLDYYLDALAANGVEADVYDVDARGRTAPDQLGVLSHYDGAIWYTGDDVVTRPPGQGAGNADRLALDEMLEFRAYLNEGGKVFYTGNWAGEQFTGNVGDQLYDPKGEGPCNPPNPAFDPRQCLLLRGSGDGTNDVLQYWLGGYLAVIGDGIDEEGNAFDVGGVDDPFESLTWGLNGGDSAANQDTTSSFLATSGILPADEYPQFESWPSSRYVKPGGPFEPHTGEQYVYSQIADVSYKRLTRVIDVPSSGDQTLNFWTSYDTEAAWDHLFVEARTPGGDDWTTLPDMNGNTTQEPGDSCAEGWTEELHPHLQHYLAFDGTSCTNGGTTGEWNAASGNSAGWQEWEINLADWADEGSVEISIAYASDWSVQNLGVFVDDVTLPDGTSTSFETDLGGWEITGPPEGSGPNANNWTRTTSSGFPVGASISTPDSILMGHGLEGISTEAERNAVMGRALDHLLD
jgi:hypothetical protein